MAATLNPVAGLALIDSPSLLLPATTPTLVCQGGVVGIIPVGGSLPGPLGGNSAATSGLLFGAPLGDASVTINPGSDAASAYLLPAATLSANRSVTIGTSGSPVAGFTVTFFRYDLTVRTFAIINGGGGGGTLFTFSSAPAKPQACSVTFDGTNWGSPTFYYLSS